MKYERFGTSYYYMGRIPKYEKPRKRFFKTVAPHTFFVEWVRPYVFGKTNDLPVIKLNEIYDIRSVELFRIERDTITCRVSVSDLIHPDDRADFAVMAVRERIIGLSSDAYYGIRVWQNNGPLAVYHEFPGECAYFSVMEEGPHRTSVRYNR